ncbi:MAG TPA: DUF4235 domain-containing protein [Streptosporangiaceae bacterium]|nr:DUF4235 domain-containing protein [Streptosporangiaceae bacterium]
MPGKGTDYVGKAINTMAGGAASFVARKAIAFAWTKVTGKQPPEAAEDRKVAIGEAIAWAVVVGAGVGVARVLAVRLASRQSGRQLPAPSDADA